MRRRNFISLVGGLAVAWPIAAGAQQSAMPVVGFIDVGSPADSGAHVASFRQGLNDMGYFEGRNILIEYRWAEGRHDRYPELAADLIRQKVNVIATGANSSASLAVKAATSTIPIVFGVGEDPVKLGLVASLARPGGNATGINFFAAELTAKRLGLLREMVPGAARLAYGTIREIDAAFASLVRQRFDALFVGPDLFFSTRRVQLAIGAARHAVPTILPSASTPKPAG